MKKPKILIDIYYLHVAQTGIRTYILSLCEAVKNNPNGRLDYLVSPRLEQIEKSRFFHGKTSRWKNLLFQFLYFLRKQLVLPFLSIIYRSDIVLSPDILSPIFARGRKVSIIHDTFFWDNPSHYHPLWLRYYLYFLHRGLAKSGFIITVTAYSKSKLIDFGLFKDCPIRVVHPASSIRLSPQTDQVSPTFPFFLHVGVMEKRKNLGMLIEAFKRVIEEEKDENLKLVLVGQRGPRESLDDWDHLVAYVAENGLEDRVVFPGYVSQDELCGYFQHAIAYVFPSLHEGFGLPILEAFSFDLPVIISDQGALKEVAGGAALVLSENSPDALKEAMKTLLNDEQIRKELIRKGRSRLNEFSSDKFFLLLEDALIEILNG